MRDRQHDDEDRVQVLYRKIEACDQQIEELRAGAQPSLADLAAVALNAAALAVTELERLEQRARHDPAADRDALRRQLQSVRVLFQAAVEAGEQFEHTRDLTR